jgi:flagellar L-ring protein precursor FlgH
MNKEKQMVLYGIYEIIRRCRQAIQAQPGAPRRSALPVWTCVTMCLCMSGCLTEGQVGVREPTTARPVTPTAQAARPANGAIFQVGGYQPMFEDRRARNVGDTLIVTINEKISASRSADSTAQRTGSASYSVPTLSKIIGGNAIAGGALDASSDNKFEGKGATSSDNAFTGTITVTVVEVLPNGNMVVSGEKQIGINRNSETVRLSGVVNPVTIVSGNTVSSTQIADARIDYRGKGYIDEAQTMGFLARFFLSVLPF